MSVRSDRLRRILIPALFTILNPAAPPARAEKPAAPAAAKIAELRAAAGRLPQSAEAHAELGAALGESGDLGGAIQELEKAVELRNTRSEEHTSELQSQFH